MSQLELLQKEFREFRQNYLHLIGCESSPKKEAAPKSKSVKVKKPKAEK